MVNNQTKRGNLWSYQLDRYKLTAYDIFISCFRPGKDSSERETSISGKLACWMSDVAIRTFVNLHLTISDHMLTQTILFLLYNFICKTLALLSKIVLLTNSGHRYVQLI